MISVRTTLRRSLLAFLTFAVAACESAVVSSEGEARLSLRFATAAGLDLSRIDQGRIRIEGPTPRTLTVAPGSTTTVDGLAPGTYAVVLEGLTNGDVEAYGETAGVVVAAGSNTPVTVTLNSFIPATVTVPVSAVPGEPFTVQFAPVAGATAYSVEWSLDASFAGAQTVQASSTSVSLTLQAEGLVHVRVRAVNRFGATGLPGAGGTVFLRERLELLLVTPPVASVPVGAEVLLNAHRLDELGTPLPGVTFTWATGNAAVATVGPNGEVRAIGPGTAVITAGGAGRVGAAEITVTSDVYDVRVLGSHAYARTVPVPSWFAARDLAVQHGGHLAVVGTQAENDFLAGYGGDRKWLGFTDQAVEGEWRWIDDTQVFVTAWQPGEPNSAGDEDCAAHEFDSTWNDLDCSLDGYFGLVEWDFTTFGVRDIVFFQGSRYARSLVPVTWTQARDLATSLGGQLVKIESAAEDAFLSSTYPVDVAIHWLGLNDRATEGTFVWADGSTGGYLNWQPGQPDDAGGTEDCAAYWPGFSGRWNDYFCGALAIPGSAEPVAMAIIEWRN